MSIELSDVVKKQIKVLAIARGVYMKELISQIILKEIENASPEERAILNLN